MSLDLARNRQNRPAENAVPDRNITADEILSLATAIPVVTFLDASNAVPLAQVLQRAGIKLVEITLRTPAGLEAITRVASEVPDLIVGAGTVLTADDLSAACAAGAHFAVSPGATRPLLAAAQDTPIPFVPGAATPSEIMTIAEWGYSALKFFPAESMGGPAALKLFLGPLVKFRFCASGGITLENAKKYLAVPNVACVAANWIAPKDVIEARDWARIEASARETLRVLVRQ